MSPIEHIVAATDFTDDGRQAARRGALLAADRNARLTLLHVVSGPSLESLRSLFPSPIDAETELVDESRRMLEGLAAEVGGAKPELQVRIGRVDDEILSASESSELLLLGARGANPLRDLILGTTAERLLRKRRKPTLVVKQPPKGGYRRVLVAVDRSPLAAEVLGLALRLAPEAEHSVLHAFDVPTEGRLWLAGVPEARIQAHRQQVRQAALGDIHGLAEQVGGDPFKLRVLVRPGDPAPCILAEEAEWGADLIVMGKRDYSRFEELLLGSTARHVLSGARCDVLVI